MPRDDEDIEFDPDYQVFQEKILKKIGLDLKLYKTKQMKRRISMLLAINNLNSFAELYDRFESDPKLFKRFLDRLTINVTEFFRNPEKFDELKTKVLPAIIKNTKSPRIWCAGCATGEEPYTIAIICREFFPHIQPRIMATDLDEDALDRAKAGVFIEKSMAGVDPALLEKYFKKDGANYKIDSRIVKMVDFKRHNLLKDRFEPGWNLIVCRNVVIYFTEDAKETLFKNFYDSLNANGFLLVGNTERIFNFREIGFHVFSAFVYRKGPEPGG